MIKITETTGGVLFEEKQHFPRWLSLLLVSPVLVTMGLTLVIETTEKDKAWGLVLIAVVVTIQLIVFYLFYALQLQKVVTPDGLFYRWAPLQAHYRFIPRREIESMEVKRSPSMKFGAGSAPGYGKLNTVSDGMGVQLYLSHGRMMFFGTGDPVFFENALRELLKTNERDALVMQR